MTFGKRRNKVVEEEDEDTTAEEPSESTQKLKINLGQLLGGAGSKDPRILGLFGPVEEEKAGELCYHLITMSEPEEPEEGEEAEAEKPEDIKFYVSTYGGSADDMFSIYDVMNFAKQRCDIQTIGLGKVMSAGVLLLAAGTKGKRKIGRNCRVMIHAVSAGNMGSLHNLVNELDEIQNLQESYIDAIVENSSFTKKTLKRLLDRKVNVYLSAEEAIEHGIADEMI